MSSNPVLHVKDAYYFEVPRGLWQYRSLDDVPAWLRESHSADHYELADYKVALDGKVIIPQPFGKLKNLYEAESGFCISKFMIILAVVAGLLVLLFSRLALHVRDNGVPKGRLWNLLESFLLFLRDQVIRPAIDGEHGHDDHGDHGHGSVPSGDARHGTVTHDAHGHAADAHHGHGSPAHGSHARESDKFLPYLWTLFFFILFCNLFGILPWLGSPTGAFTVTLVLAACTMLAGFMGGNLKFGPLGFWLNMIPSMDLPLVLAIFLKPMIFFIELGGWFIKHAILAVRLLANMVAGHLVIAGIMGLIATAGLTYINAKEPSEFSYWMTAALATIGSTLFFMLELFVAFLQAYLFTFLSSLFIGASVHKH